MEWITVLPDNNVYIVKAGHTTNPVFLFILFDSNCHKYQINNAVLEIITVSLNNYIYFNIVLEIKLMTLFFFSLNFCMFRNNSFSAINLVQAKIIIKI